MFDDTGHSSRAITRWASEPREETACALVVDDDADTRANLRDILELDDWRVETAGTAREVLNRNSWSEISIVILDRKLPDGNAQQLLPEIKRLAPHASVIIATGYADLDDAILALRHGAADYLLKPVNPDALRASMSRLIEQKQTERALGESQRRLQQERDFAESLIQTAQTIVLLLDTEGRVVHFNPYLEEVSGYRLQEVQGADWFNSFLAEQDRDRTRELFRNVTVTGRIDGYVNPILTKRGDRRDIQWSAKTLHDAGGKILGILACGQDITELKQAQERVLQSERLAAIGQMMAGLAHESRNALQRSKACLEMLALEVENRPSALDLVARAQRAQDHLSTLYEEVRQYAAPIQLNRKQANLDELWRETWEDLVEMHKSKKVRLGEDLGGFDLCCSVDRFAIGQVWRNILENAIQVSPDCAQVFVQCAESTIDGHPAVRIGIRDEGPGMTADHRKRVFQPFFTTKTKGTGLGMAIAERIVLSHGGWIGVADRDGPGAEIIVILPKGEG
jgi:two-component system, LuxR family, sensor kinase FixL